MALHAKELIWRATAAVSRQLQVSALPYQGCPLSTHALSVMSVRSLYSTPYTCSMRQPGSGSTAGPKGIRPVNRNAVERVRITFPSKAGSSNRLQPVTSPSVTGGKKLLNQPLKSSTKSGTQNEVFKNNTTAKTSDESTTAAHIRPYRKHIIKAKKMSAAKKKRIENGLSLTEPMSKLSRDINRWFSEVMEHLARAESALPTFATEKAPTASRKQQALNKTNSSLKTKGQAQTENTNTVKKSSDYTKNIPSPRQDKALADESVTLKSKKEKQNEKVLMKSQTSSSPKNLCKDDYFTRTGQDSIQNKRIPSSSLKDGNERFLIYGSRVIKSSNGALSNEKAHMLEIKPYSVENSGTNEACLATTAGWLPYGSHQDTLGSKKCGQTKEKPPQAKTVVKSAGSATLASEIFSGPSRHELVSNAIFSGSSKTGSSKPSKQNSWETGKGFILLNNKEKAQEALERQEWLRKNQNFKTSSNAKNTGFILVDPDKPSSISLKPSNSSKNILLSDNPHEATAKRAASKKNNTVRRKVDANKDNDKEIFFKGSNKPPMRAVTTEDGNDLFRTKKKLKQERNDMTKASTATDPEIKRWVDLVQQKIHEIQQTKMASSRFKEKSQSQAQQGLSKKERIDAKQGLPQNIDGKTIEMQSGVPSKAGRVTGTTNPPVPSAIKNPSKGSLKDPKPVENSDADYARRIRQFIDSSMGYEESSGANKITKLFGPLTREQSEMLEMAKKFGVEQNLKDNLKEYQVRSKNYSNSATVEELKPEIQSRHKGVKGEKFSCKNSEPTLYVRPEELAPVKKLSRAALVENLGRSNDLVSQGKTSTKSTKDANNEINLKILNEELGFKKMRDEKSKKESGFKSVSNVSRKANEAPPSEVSLNRNSGRDTNLFQHEFLRLQQEKLDKSRNIKSPLETIGQSPNEKGMKPSPCPDTLKIKTDSKHAEILSSVKPKPSFVLVEPSQNGITAFSSKKESSAKKLESKRKSPLDTSSEGELDPFEAWIQSMEDWKPAHKNKFSSFSGALNLSGDTTDSLQPTEINAKENKNYSRFEAKTNYPTETPKDSQKPQLKFVTPGDKDVFSRATGDAKRCSEKVPSDVKLSAVSQSDQLYNMIVQESTKPLSGLTPHSFITSPAPKSKVLTQAGMGAVISNNTGQADPAKMPKLGNLFSSFDGFIAMDATPVSVEKPTSPKLDSPAEKNAMLSYKTEAASGDKALDNNLRATLAKEREAATKAARKRLIEEYEKNIKMYERSLELYRSRLRRVRQSMAEHKQEQTKASPRSDNPRRHSDL